ncbi:30S ribosomal protein S15 [Candidatus Saccharibacteria bacterium CG_4_10_14_0_2_um_filter_52_9]|nr:MAG: 30S ribosomal protein S15 [Candidatus Saccharibacteria bacterium CG_4_10_14_0_2_um_filter_52_9]
MIASEKKAATIKSAQVHKDDTGGSSAQVAVLTERIKEITEHLQTNKHDFMARRGLLQMVGKRRRLLRYIAKHDSQAYLALIKKLGIRR